MEKKKAWKPQKENKQKIKDKDTDVMAYPEWSFTIVIHRIACLD